MLLQLLFYEITLYAICSLPTNVFYFILEFDFDEFSIETARSMVALFDVSSSVLL